MAIEINSNNIEYCIVKLSDNTKIRKEHFGGIIFNKGTGDIIEVDREAFTVVSAINDVEITGIKILLQMLSINKKSTVNFLLRLINMGVIDVLPNGILSESYKKMLYGKIPNRISWPAYQYLSAPETVHWAVTYRCDELCPDCYVERYKTMVTYELDTYGAFNVIDKIADSGAFQLAMGGGEPFKRDDLEAITCRAWEKGLVTHITTGRYEIEPERLDSLAKYIKTLQIGIRTEELLNGKAEVCLGKLVMKLNERGIIPGANLIMTRNCIWNMEELVERLSNIGFKRLTLLRYKPPASIGRWLKEKPDRNDLELLEEKLTTIQKNHGDITFRIDCALTFIERIINPQIALNSGIRGCAAAQRILSVAPDGSVYPCSQLVGDKFKAGNLYEDDFYNIWNNSDVVKKYRGFRNTKAFKKQACGKCKAKVFCGGCRVFAGDAIGSDTGCPEPLFEGKNKGEVYDDIAEIQDMLGCTDAGFPYVTREEIEKWLEEGNNRDYPLWIKNMQA